MKIDTSTTAGKIQVMQAFDDGKAIEKYVDGHWCGVISKSPTWGWTSYSYRIKPQTLEDAVSEAIDSEIPELQKSEIGWARFGAKWQMAKGTNG